MLVMECERRWGIRVGRPLPNLSYNYVASATGAGGAAAILKLGYPGPGFEHEAEALRVFDGRAAAQLLELDLDAGAMLIERVVPGRPLGTVQDEEEAMAAAASVMRRVWRPVPAPHSFPTVAEWAEGFERLHAQFDGGAGPMPVALVERAEAAFADLIASQRDPVLLHGDLHHGNILSSTRDAWLAIDPKGLVGEREYEVGALLRNPDSLLRSPSAGRILERRIARLSDELTLDRERVRNWAAAQAVLAAYWGWEDHGQIWQDALEYAELLWKIRA